MIPSETWSVYFYYQIVIVQPIESIKKNIIILWKEQNIAMLELIFSGIFQFI